MDTDINIPDSYLLYLTYTLVITHRDRNTRSLSGMSKFQCNSIKRYVEFNFVAVESMDSNIKEFQFLKLNNIYIYCDCN